MKSIHWDTLISGVKLPSSYLKYSQRINCLWSGLKGSDYTALSRVDTNYAPDVAQESRDAKKLPRKIGVSDTKLSPDMCILAAEQL